MSGLIEIYNQKKGIRLENWLSDPKNKRRIYGKRIFYIVKANLDDKKTNKTKSIYKFGIAGSGGKGGAAARLESYINSYGRHSKQNPAAGVMLYFLAGNAYNKNILREKSKVFLREKFIKDILKQEELISENRGSERTFADLDYIKNLIAGTTPRAPSTEQEVVRTMETRGVAVEPENLKDYVDTPSRPLKKKKR